MQTIQKRELVKRTVHIEHDLTDLRDVPTVPTMHGTRRGDDPRKAVVVSVMLTYAADSDDRTQGTTFYRLTPNGWLASWKATLRPFLKSGGLGDPIRAERYSTATSRELRALVEALLVEHEPPAPSIGEWS